MEKYKFSEVKEVKKDNKWLKEEITEILLTSKKDGTNYFYYRDLKEKIYNAIDQFDNQETLSQAWIDENHFETENWAEDLYKSDGETIDHTPQIKVIAVQDLQNLLVPKQELPVIPKFVAEFLIGKEDYMLYELLDDEWLYKEHDRVAKWLYDNDELTNRQREIDLVMARDRGYTVEKEPKYVVRTNLGTYLILDMNKREWDYTSIPHQDDDIQYAYKFNDRSMAEGIAKLVEGKVDELKE